MLLKNVDSAFKNCYNMGTKTKKEAMVRTIEQICEDLTGINAMVFMRGTNEEFQAFFEANRYRDWETFFSKIGRAHV